MPNRIVTETIWTAFKHKTPASAPFAGQTSYAANGTNPTLLLRKLAGAKKIRPHRLDLSQEGVVAGGLIRCVIKIDQTDRYVSGGTPWQVKNPQMFDPSLTPEFSVLESPTVSSEAALDPVTIFDGDIFQTVTSLGLGFVFDFLPHHLLGPTGNVLIYLFAPSTAPTFVGTLEIEERD